MTTKSNCILYTCIAKGTTVLADFNFKDADLAALAVKCLEKKPPNHENFFHTVNGRTYTFLIDDPFIYFAIYIDSLEKTKGIAFLHSVKESFDKFKVDSLITSYRCFQDEFYPIFIELLRATEYVEPPMKGKKNYRHNRSESLDSMGKNFGSRLFPGGDYSKMVKKTRKRSSLVASGNEIDDDDQFNSDDSIVGRKKDLLRGDAGQRERRRGWRKHVWFVLSIDVIICCILFAVWLWI